MALQLSQEDLKDIMAQVEADLDQVLKSERSSSSSSSSMGKDEESGASPDVSAAPAESSGGEGGGSPAGDDAGGPPMDGGAPPMGDPSAGGAPPMSDPSAGGMPPGGAAPGGMPPGGSPAGAPGGDPLEAQLAAMPPDQLRHLYMVAKAALFQQLSSGQDPAAAAGAPPASPSPAAASPAPGMPPPAMKAEGDPDKLASDGKSKAPSASLKQDVFAAAKKSEDQGREIADLKNQVQGLMKAVEIVLGQPMRKAITHISQVQKPAAAQVQAEIAGLSKSEITGKLKDLDYSKLTKKDREVINGFYDGRNGSDRLAYLFATK